MNDLEMELQTIRQKLQTLKATPPETIAAPWGQAQFASPSPNLAQVTTAIEALRQRSIPQERHHSPAILSLHQFDAALAAIDSLAQQQLHALQRLQQLGDGLMGQTQPGISPDIDDIARFFSHCPTLQIPTVHRDPEGYLDMAYHAINFRQAEYDATSNAETLRMRSQLFKAPLAQPQSSQSRNPKDRHRSVLSHPPNSFLGELTTFLHLAYNSIQTWLQQLFPHNQRPNLQRFTLLDGVIWFIGAMIVRIILHQMFQLYPALWTPVALCIVVGITISLYSAILRPRSNSTLGYRLMMSILGLLVGGYFL